MEGGCPRKERGTPKIGGSALKNPLLPPSPGADRSLRGHCPQPDQGPHGQVSADGTPPNHFAPSLLLWPPQNRCMPLPKITVPPPSLSPLSSPHRIQAKLPGLAKKKPE